MLAGMVVISNALRPVFCHGLPPYGQWVEDHGFPADQLVPRYEVMGAAARLAGIPDMLLQSPDRQDLRTSIRCG